MIRLVQKNDLIWGYQLGNKTGKRYIRRTQKKGEAAEHDMFLCRSKLFVSLKELSELYRQTVSNMFLVELRTSRGI